MALRYLKFAGQWIKLKKLKKLIIVIHIKQLKIQYPEADVIGHNEISEKECPSFDVQKWKEDNL